MAIDNESLVSAQKTFAYYATQFLLMYHVIGMVSLTFASLSIVFRREVLSHTTGIPHDVVLFTGMAFGTIGTLLQTFLYKVKMHTTAKSCERIASLLSIYLSGLETSSSELEMIRKTIITELREIDLLWYPIPYMGMDGQSADTDSDPAPRILSKSIKQDTRKFVEVSLP